MNKSAVTCFSDLIGVEFSYGGRGPDRYDCWGLVQECYRRWHGIELPDYRSTPHANLNAEIMTRESRAHWRKLPEATPGSVLLIRVGRFGAHVGFVTSPTRFLHALEGLGVQEVRLSRFERQIIGAYDYAGHGS